MAKKKTPSKKKAAPKKATSKKQASKSPAKKRSKVQVVQAAKTGPQARNAVVQATNAKQVVEGMEVVHKQLPKITDKVKNIVIIGSSATGKTTVANYLHSLYPDMKVYHSDNYKSPNGENNFKQALYDMMNDMRMDISPRKIVEGIQGVRLLRKGIELNSFRADLIIICESEWDTRVKRYSERGEAHKLPFLAGFDKMLGKIFKDYLDMLKGEEKKPKIVTIKT